MIGRAAIALACVAAPAALALGYWQGQSSDLDVAMAPLPINAPVVAKPGEGAADAVHYLATINGVDRPAASAAPAKIDASQPQVDIALQFRRDVTAVLTGDEPHVVLSGGRQLGSGEVYRDGWKVRDISSQHATLTKGSERRDVNLFSAPPIEIAQASSPGGTVLTGPISLTNGLTADQRTAALQQQRNMMMQILQQQMGGRLPGGLPGGGFPGGQGGGRGGRQNAGAGATPNFGGFTGGFGSDQRGRNRQGQSGTPPAAPAPEAPAPVAPAPVATPGNANTPPE